MTEQYFNDLTESVSNFSEVEEVIRQTNENFTRALEIFVGANQNFFTAKKITSSQTLTRSKRALYVPVTSSSSAITVILPLADIDGTYIKENDTILITDRSNNAETYNITVNLNGSRINGSASNLTINKNSGCIWLRYAGWDSVNNWGLWEVIYDNSQRTLCLGLSPSYNATFQHRILSLGVIASISTGSSGGEFYGISSRSSLDTPVAISSGEAMCNLRGVAYNGSAFAIGARIALQPSQTWEPTKQGTQMTFFATPNDSTTIATALQLLQNKNLVLYGGLRVNTNNTYDAFTASSAPKDTFTVNPVSVTSDPRTKNNRKKLELGMDFINALIEEEAVISWTWKDFSVEEIRSEESIKVFDNESQKEIEIKTPVVLQEAYQSNHKRTHVGTDSFRFLKALKKLGITTEQLSMVNIEGFKPEMLELISDMSEEEFLNLSFEDFGKMTIKEAGYIPILMNALYEKDKELKDIKSRISVIENVLGIGV